MNSMRTVLYAGDPLLSCNIVKGMSAEQITQILAEAIEVIYKGQSLEGIELAKFGIVCTPEDKSSLLNLLLQKILKDMLILSERVSQVANFNSNVKESVGTITDERVKVTKDSKETKYLTEAITGTPGRIKVVADKVAITGLIPVGARMMISPARKGDFDSNSKGKVGTDLEGWAIRNGANGLDNAMGRMAMYTDTLDNAGKKAGRNQATLKLENIESFTLTIGGQITPSLGENIKVRTPVGVFHKCFGSGSCRDVHAPGQSPRMIESEGLNLKHTHAHTLTAGHSIPQATPVDLVPEHIKEIPIEFIGL